LSWERYSWEESERGERYGPALADRVAYGLSLVLNPLTVEGLAVLWPWTRGDVLGSLLGLTVVGTVLATALAYIRANDTDVFLTRKEDRLPLIAVGGACNGAGALAARLLDASPLASAILLTYALACLIVYLVTRRWKISIHASSAGTLIGLLCYAGDWGLLTAWLPVAGAVCWARLRMNAHTLDQIVLGTAGGAALTYCSLTLLLSAR